MRFRSYMNWKPTSRNKILYRQRASKRSADTPRYRRSSTKPEDPMSGIYEYFKLLGEETEERIRLKQIELSPTFLKMWSE
jgi:hypothetical protein